MKNLAMLPSYFDYIFVHLRQKVRLRPQLSPKFLSTLGPDPPRLTTLEPSTRFQGVNLVLLELFVLVAR